MRRFVRGFCRLSEVQVGREASFLRVKYSEWGASAAPDCMEEGTACDDYTAHLMLLPLLYSQGWETPAWEGFSLFQTQGLFKLILHLQPFVWQRTPGWDRLPAGKWELFSILCCPLVI